MKPLLLCGLCFISLQVLAVADITEPRDPAPVFRSVGVPHAFRQLLEPQTTEIDIYYQGGYLLSTVATYTPFTITFRSPAQIVDAVPNIIARPLLIDHLAEELPSHSAKICLQEQLADCGQLSPEFIGVIFNEAEFRADLFVNPELIEVQQEQATGYLPPSESKLALVQNLQAVYSDNNTGETQYSLIGDTYLGYETQRIHSNWLYDNTNTSQVMTLSLDGDTQKHWWRAGLMRNNIGYLNFVTSSAINGVAFGRSLNLLNNPQELYSPEIQLFIANRSQIDLYRDDRLYDSQIYNPGMNSLDTSSLPAGSYNLKIVITDDFGNQRTINRFYVKSNLLAPIGIPLYFFSAGKVTIPDPTSVWPEDGDEWLAQFNYLYRLAEPLGLTAGLASTSDTQQLESSLTWLRNRSSISIEAMASTDQDWGYGLQANQRFMDLSGNIGLRKIHASQEQDPLQYRMVPTSYAQQSYSLSHPILNGTLSLTGNISQAANEEKIEQYGAQFSKAVLQDNRSALSMNLEYIDGDQDRTFLLGLNYSYRSHHWQHTASPYYLSQQSQRTNEPSREGVSVNAGTSWRDQELFAEDIQWQLNGDIQPEQESINTQLYASSAWGRFNISSQRTFLDQQNDTTSTSASINSTVLATANAIAWGGQQAYSSGIILNLTSDTNDTAFDIMINGQNYGIARSGRANVVALQPYKTYLVQLLERGGDFVEFDHTPKQVTLYPGNVVSLNYEVERVVVVFGKLQRSETICPQSLEQGECYTLQRPVKNGRFANLPGFNMTDEYGLFQIEAKTSRRNLVVTYPSGSCIVTLPSSLAQTKKSFYQVGTLDCHPVDKPSPENESSPSQPEQQPLPPAP